MKNKPRITNRAVTILKKPKARYVSLVNHGANQTPFDTVKQVNGENAMAQRPRKIKKVKNVPSAKKTAPEVVDSLEETAVLRIEFSKKHFATKDAVEDYIVEQEWTECEIEETANSFILKSTAYTEEDFVDVKAVEVASVKGATAYIGELADTGEEDEDENASKSADDEEDEDDTDEDGDEDEDEDGEDATKSSDDDTDDEDDDEDDEDDEETASKSEDEDGDEDDTEEDEDEDAVKARQPLPVIDEFVKKFSYYDAYMSGDKSLKDVLEAGLNDGVPPGANEIFDSLYTAMKNILKGGEDVKKNLTSLGNDFAETMTALDSTWRKLVAKGTKAQKAAARKYLVDIGEREAGDDKAKKSVGLSADDLAEAVAKAVEKAVEKAVKPLNDEIAEQNKVIGKLRKGVPARKSAVTEDADLHEVETDEVQKGYDDDAEFLSGIAAKGAFGGY